MNQNIAVYLKEPQHFQTISSAAEKSDFIFHHNPESDEFLKDHLVVCDYASFKEDPKLDSVSRDLLYVISPLSDEENMRLIKSLGLCHLVGLNEQVFAQELLCQLSKHQAKNIWGLSHYMEPSSEIKQVSLSDSKFTNEMIKDALSHFNFEDYFSSPFEYIQVMANELISNSLYKGPNRRRQEQGLDGPDRRSPVFLKGSELVQVTLSMDSRGVALSVQDSFGGLSYETLISNLMRSFDEKTALEKKDGAGLGLYLTFLHSNQLIINFRENYRTEVICIIERNKRYKTYKQRIRSFHYFQEVAR